MITKHIFKFFVAVALFVAVVGGSGVAGDALGLEVTPSAYACGGAGAGGSC